MLALLPVVLSVSLFLKKSEQEACQLIGVTAFIDSDPKKSHQGPSVKKRKNRLNASKINRKHPFLKFFFCLFVFFWFFLFLSERGIQ